MNKKEKGLVSCQGVPGAFAHLAAEEIFPQKEVVFYATFEEALEAVACERADCAVLPVENSAAGRVADMHRLMGKTKLYVIAEHFLRIRHCLVGLPETQTENIKTVRSHPQALSQCAAFLKKMNVRTEATGNTAAAAKEIADSGRKDIAAIASETAAKLYGLKILKAGIEDFNLNTTRFWVLSRTPGPAVDPDKAVTSFIFWVKNKPAVLYKCLGGFATNGIDLLRLESYVDPERFLTSAGFLVDVAACPESDSFKRAFEELAFFSEKVKILGTYEADPYRAEMKKRQQENRK